MMRSNTSHDEDDEDTIDSRLGNKSESKVGKYMIFSSFFTLFESLHYSHIAKSFYIKVLFLNE